MTDPDHLTCTPANAKETVVRAADVTAYRYLMAYLFETPAFGHGSDKGAIDLRIRTQSTAGDLLFIFFCNGLMNVYGGFIFLINFRLYIILTV